MTRLEAETVVDAIALATRPLHERLQKLEGKSGVPATAELRELVNALDRRLSDLEQAATNPTTGEP